MRAWIIFECPHDGSIVVSRLEGDRALGVCECPDIRTAEAVLEAMRVRDDEKGRRPAGPAEGGG